MKCFTIINQNDLENLTAEMLVKIIDIIPRTTIKELRYSDLYQPKNSCHGIYFIQSFDDKYYFGKASKRCIADRIGAHFDSRQQSFLNSLLKRIAQSDVDEVLDRCYNRICNWQFGVLFVEGEESEYLCKLIELTERILIYKHKENCFNRCKRKQDYPTNKKLTEILNL